MFVSKNESEFFYGKAIMFSTHKLHALDEYWSNNSSNPTHKKIHEIIENILIQRGAKTLKQERLNLVNTLENSLLISNPMGRFSTNLIELITKIQFSNTFTKIRKNLK